MNNSRMCNVTHIIKYWSKYYITLAILSDVFIPFCREWTLIISPGCNIESAQCCAAIDYTRENRMPKQVEGAMASTAPHQKSNTHQLSGTAVVNSHRRLKVHHVFTI